LQAHHAAAPMRWVRGFYSEASKHFESCLALYDEEHHAQHRYHYLGHDPAVCAILSSEPKCNTPADLIIGTVDQDLRECCHAMLFAFVG